MTTKTTKATQTQATQVTSEQQVVNIINDYVAKNDKITTKAVSGYTSVKYNNKVLFELHLKKRSISHVTFGKTQKVFELLKQNELITRIVDASFGWKLDTECLITKQFADKFAELMQNVVNEYEQQCNLKQAKIDKKAKKAVA